MLSDSQLLRAYSVHGSQEAFGELVQRHLPLVYRSALRQLSFDTHRAEDVSQMVFLSLARQAPQLVSHTNLSAWLYSTTHRTTCQVLRAEMRRRKREQVWVAQADADPPGSASPWTQVAPALDEAIRALGAKDREVVLLRFFSDRSFAEIGQVLRIGEDAARMRVNRALDKLRELLGRRGLSVTPTALAGLIASDAALGAPVGLASTIAGAAFQAGPVAVSIGGAWISFMAASKLMTVATVLVAVVVVGVSLQQQQASRIATVELESAQRNLVSLQHQIAVAERPVASTPRPSLPASAPTAVTAINDLEAAEREKGDRFLAAHPEVREALVQAQRARIRGKYLPLYRELNLTEAQMDEFEETLLGASGWVSPNAGFLYVGEVLSLEERENRLRALLGEPGFARYKAARLPGNGYAAAQALARRLAFTDDPLTPEKSIAVRDIIDAVRSETDAGGDIWTKVLPRLGSVLTRGQMDEMNAVCALDRYQRARTAAGKK